MVVPSQPPSETKPSKPISETRKIRKPIMEKKRRDRINNCLQELAALVSEEGTNKSQNNKNARKVEKADILELTVKHWQNHKSKIKETDNSYLKGYKQCMKLTDTLLKEYDDSTKELRTNIQNHLKTKIVELSNTKLSEIHLEKHLESKVECENNSKHLEKEKYTEKAKFALIPKKMSNNSIVFVLQNATELYPTNIIESDKLFTENKKEPQNTSIVLSSTSDVNCKFNDNVNESDKSQIKLNIKPTNSIKSLEPNKHNILDDDSLDENGIQYMMETDDMWRPWGRDSYL